MITRPEYMDFKQWTSQLFIDFPGVNFPIFSGGDWKQWVSDTLHLSNFYKYALPQPGVYGKWEDWAYEFIKVVEQ